MTPKDYAQLALKCYTDTPTDGVEDSAARCVVYGDVEAFPGTNNLACWLADLSAEAVHVNGFGRLHEGFWRSYKVISPLLAKNTPDVCVGHSEGAALAILRAAYLCLQGTPPKAVYAFEPPRVTCDSNLAKLFAAHGVQVNLYWHGNDVVPMVPRLLEDWQHPAPMIRFGKASEPWPNVADHLMAGIIADL